MIITKRGSFIFICIITTLIITLLYYLYSYNPILIPVAVHHSDIVNNNSLTVLISSHIAPSPSPIPSNELHYIDPHSINESGFIPYTLSLSSLNDLSLIGGRVPQRVNIPVNYSDIFFTVKTAAKFADRLQLVMLTWAQTVDREQIAFITDGTNNWTDAFSARGYMIYNAAHCGLGHKGTVLCCKSGVEYEAYYKAIESGKDYNWLCHIDDDQYYNVWKLKRVLVNYDPMEPWYIGKCHHGASTLTAAQKIAFPKAKKPKWKFNTGNVYCLSKQMMKEVEGYLRDKNFHRTCQKTGRTDDVTIAIIIVSVLGHTATQERQMWSHLERLDGLPENESLKMVSFGYGHMEGPYKKRWNTSLSLPLPRFHYNNDPTRFLSYHCMMYPTTKWCL